MEESEIVVVGVTLCRCVAASPGLGHICDHVGLAGGPFVMLLGRDYAVAASLCLRIALLILPALHSTMWCTRFLRDFGKVSNSKYRGVIMTRGVLAAVCVCQVSYLAGLRAVEHVRHPVTRAVFPDVGCQVVFLLFHDFNGIQGSLAGFWIAALTAAIWESLVATYDLRGQGRQLLYLIIFILI